MLHRISASIVILLSLLFMPFWLSAVLAVGAMLYFNMFWEAVILFLLSDLLYGVSEPRLFNTTYATFIISVFALAIIEFIKKRTIFYPSKSQR
jgi:hypothetical protein